MKGLRENGHNTTRRFVIVELQKMAAEKSGPTEVELLFPNGNLDASVSRGMKELRAFEEFLLD